MYPNRFNDDDALFDYLYRKFSSNAVNNYDKGKHQIVNSLSQENQKNTITFKPKRIYCNDPWSVVLWEDGTTTKVKVSEGDHYDKITGVALCYLKKIMGTSYMNTIKKDIKKKECHNKRYEKNEDSKDNKKRLLQS